MELADGGMGDAGWIEPTAILVSVAIIVNVAASTDYVKSLSFRALSKKLEGAEMCPRLSPVGPPATREALTPLPRVAESNKKVVLRRGVPIEVEDDGIVVGDVLSFNAHTNANIPCDGILLSGADVKVDESSLTGEPEPQAISARSRLISGADLGGRSAPISDDLG